MITAKERRWLLERLAIASRCRCVHCQILVKVVKLVRKQLA